MCVCACLHQVRQPQCMPSCPLHPCTHLRPCCFLCLLPAYALCWQDSLALIPFRHHACIHVCWQDTLRLVPFHHLACIRLCWQDSLALVPFRNHACIHVCWQDTLRLVPFHHLACIRFVLARQPWAHSVPPPCLHMLTSWHGHACAHQAVLPHLHMWYAAALALVVRCHTCTCGSLPHLHLWCAGRSSSPLYHMPHPASQVLLIRGPMTLTPVIEPIAHPQVCTPHTLATLPIMSDVTPPRPPCFAMLRLFALSPVPAYAYAPLLARPPRTHCLACPLWVTHRHTHGSPRAHTASPSASHVHAPPHTRLPKRTHRLTWVPVCVWVHCMPFPLCRKSCRTGTTGGAFAKA